MKFEEKKIKLLGIFLCVLAFAQVNIYAQGDANSAAIPEGMELVEMSPGYKILVPKGQKINKMGDANILENLAVYVARRFSQMEARISELESKQKICESEIIILKKRLAQTQNDLQLLLKDKQEK
jgi:hypothetical protein